MDEKCSHVVYPSKYERNDPVVANWWYKTFELLESEAFMPPELRLEVVNQIFSEKLLDRISSILTIRRKCKIQLEEEKSKIKKDVKKRKSSTSSLSTPKKSLSGIRRRELGPTNPYLKFFRRKPDRAAIWHTLPPLSLEEMNLSQKAEAITTAIAVDFVEWMESISDEDSPTTLTVPLVLKMFEIGFDNHASRSLQVRVKEMASVPDGVALLKGIPDMAKRSQLHRQLLRDLAASKEKKRVFAFGRKLSKDKQILPPKMSEIDKWLVCTKVPPHLESMATVWQGITHLRSTIAYCEYLINHPEITPPKFLVDMKMLDKDTLKDQKHGLAETEDGPVQVPKKSLTADEKPTLSQEMMV